MNTPWISPKPTRMARLDVPVVPASDPSQIRKLAALVRRQRQSQRPAHPVYGPAIRVSAKRLSYRPLTTPSRSLLQHQAVLRHPPQRRDHFLILIVARFSS